MSVQVEPSARRLHFSRVCPLSLLLSFSLVFEQVLMAQVPKSYPRPGPLGQTDPNRWRLWSATDGGRHVWHYARDPDAPETTGPYESVWGPDSEQLREQEEQNDETAYWLGLDLPFPTDKVSPEPAATPIQAAHKGESRIEPSVKMSGPAQVEATSPQDSNSTSASSQTTDTGQENMAVRLAFAPQYRGANPILTGFWAPRSHVPFAGDHHRHVRDENSNPARMEDRNRAVPRQPATRWRTGRSRLGDVGGCSSFSLERTSWRGSPRADRSKKPRQPL